MSEHLSPLLFIWEGDLFRPANPMVQARADKRYVIGQKYALMEFQERSGRSHRHYHAALHEAWQNLPEAIAKNYPTVEHLRKRALIEAGFYDAHTVTFNNRTDALKAAAFMRPMDEFSVVTTKGATVTRYSAKSQSYQAMGKDDFNRSKSAVLDVVSSMIGLSREQLEENAGRAA